MSNKTKELLIRAFKTFIQAFLGYLCTVSIMDIDWSNKKIVIGVLLSAISAGISALMNIDWSTNTSKSNEEKLG